MLILHLTVVFVSDIGDLQLVKLTFFFKIQKGINYMIFPHITQNKGMEKLSTLVKVR